MSWAFNQTRNERSERTQNTEKKVINCMAKRSEINASNCDLKCDFIISFSFSSKLQTKNYIFLSFARNFFICTAHTYQGEKIAAYFWESSNQNVTDKFELNSLILKNSFIHCVFCHNRLSHVSLACFLFTFPKNFDKWWKKETFDCVCLMSNISLTIVHCMLNLIA